MSDDQNQPIESTTSATKLALTRDEARALIFGAKAIKSKEIPFNGVKVIINEPSVDDVTSAQNNTEDQKYNMVTLIIKYTTLPSGEKIFDDSDLEGLVALPFNKDFRELLGEITTMIGVVPTEDTKSPAKA